VGASTSQVERVKRLCAIEANDVIYRDDVVAEFIEGHPVNDSEGRAPDDDLWEETYDLNFAAADICEEKAAAVAARFDFNADGGSYTRSQEFDHWSRLASRYRSRRFAVSHSLRSSRPYVMNDADDDLTLSSDGNLVLPSDDVELGP
jgi:hypothetical protein